MHVRIYRRYAMTATPARTSRKQESARSRNVVIREMGNKADCGTNDGPIATCKIKLGYLSYLGEAKQPRKFFENNRARIEPRTCEYFRGTYREPQ